MAKITNYEGEIPKRIGNLVFYKLRGNLIVRTNSGFTSEAINNDSKYTKTLNNASEFGKVSSLCKNIRVALAHMLPKNNNWDVVNSFTKKMYEVMTHDLVSARGERNLAEALKNETGRQLLKDYEFNPDTVFDFSYSIIDNSINLNTNTIIFPKVANSIGFRTHILYFDFTTRENQMQSADWHLYNKSSLPCLVDLTLPFLENGEGVVFTILETGFFDYKYGSYLPVADDRGKSVRIVAIC